MTQTGIFNGRVLVPYAYGCYGYTRGGGKTWHGGIDLVGLDDEHIAKLQESSPYYEEYIIPEGTYEGIPETKTVAVVATVIARDDVSEDDVYNICYTIFENMDNLAHDKAKELDVEFAAGVTAVPYHAGAAKYFAEKGFDVPTK